MEGIYDLNIAFRLLVSSTKQKIIFFGKKKLFLEIGGLMPPFDHYFRMCNDGISSQDSIYVF